MHLPSTGHAYRCQTKVLSRSESPCASGELPVAHVENSLLYHKLRLYIPEGLQERIMSSEHDSRVAGHFGQDKTLELIRRNFWWPADHCLRAIVPAMPTRQGAETPAVWFVIPS